MPLLHILRFLCRTTAGASTAGGTAWSVPRGPPRGSPGAPEPPDDPRAAVDDGARTRPPRPPLVPTPAAGRSRSFPCVGAGRS